MTTAVTDDEKRQHLRDQQERAINRRKASATPAPATRIRETANPELAESFRRLGMSPRGASIAARGREGIGAEVDPYQMKTPTFSQRGFTAKDFALAIDPKDDTTWFGLLTPAPGGKADPGMVGQAVRDLLNATDGSPTGSAAGLNATDAAALKKKLVAAWLEANPGPNGIALPPALGGPGAEAARRADGPDAVRAFERLGLSPAAADVAAAGRAAGTVGLAEKHIERRGGRQVLRGTN